MGVAVQGGQRRLLQVAEDVDAQALDRALGQAGGVERHQPLEERAQGDGRGQRAQKGDKAAEVDLPRAHDKVDTPPHQHRAQQGQRDLEDGKEQRQREVAAVGTGIGQESADELFLFHAWASCASIWDRQISR